ncbi:hypothetical protein PRBRB14_19780 [Hallella multisaccharivorax DSM 17128]|uniref:Rpn family recombination-promoting nuclease/putative transposase n=1 Tax=Hallella multisaccharivorax DSM 17128 TaxID=688246 RepID=F8N8P6_9BACT|nr:Rpn family recombination-promoting nuclease/putative transposase [Hallella multisaccharivorax]EGN57641.1 hypothetical protein CHP01784 [Hallella multisaccharivorax DSM 17128]GJG31099.1 hypothetical protein PRBRB14_19780 [Hallella multisaccharivorax DSM 17128]
MKNENNKKYIRFDWAMKRMLRDKANFAVLEGFLTTLLGHPIKIQKLLESESNQDDADDKQNRVDLLAEDEAGQLYLIEVQNETEVAYFQRMLFGASKLVTEYINRGDNYDRVRKVYSINIVYFNLGGGTDIVYHGKTEFRGIHNGELLPLSPFQKQKFKVDTVSDLYPEYYILKVNDFNRWSKVPLEQWIYFLNTSEIPHDATAPGLGEARHRLEIDQMSPAERESYYRHLDNVAVLKDNISTARGEGKMEGRAEGRVEGRAEGRVEGRAEGRVEGRAEAAAEIARKMKEAGIPAKQIATLTGLDVNTL